MQEKSKIKIIKMRVKSFLDRAQFRVEAHLNKKLIKKNNRKTQKKTFKSEALDWLGSLCFAVVVVFFVSLYFAQLFVIPSGSMQNTLMPYNRVGVYKRAYGTELCAFGSKSDKRTANRGDIIVFYNPEYKSKGIVKENLSNALFLMTLSLYNPSKEEKLFVKRAIGEHGDVIRFENGRPLIKHFSYDDYVLEDNSSLNYNPVYINDKNGYVDRFTYDQLLTREEYAKTPFNVDILSDYHKYNYGMFIKEKHILPLGDNRLNSYDGRYFGPIKMDKIIGRVIFRFYPIQQLKVF